MNQTWMAARQIALVIAVTFGGGYALAGEVTVVGSPPGPRCCNLAPQAAPPSPSGVLQPTPADGSADPTLGPLFHPNEAGGPNIVGADLVVCPGKPIESNYYTRIDYFRWIEPRGGDDKTTETGPLYTLGYARRVGSERLRGELFGGVMKFSAADGSSGTPDPWESSTSYIGLRGEFEHLWNLCDGWPAIFVGIGTRLWVRDIRDGTTQAGVDEAPGQQTWWTIYPYLGLEKKWLCDDGNEIFLFGRLGCTVLTYEHSSWPDVPAFFPRPGITGQLECGVRHKQLSLSAYFEAMTWQDSQSEHLHYGTSTDFYVWPASQMYTTGLKLGWCF